MHCPSCKAEKPGHQRFLRSVRSLAFISLAARAARPTGRTPASAGHCGNQLDSAKTAALNSGQLLRSLSASGGEYKRLTVLFADIRNSTGLIASMGSGTRDEANSAGARFHAGRGHRYEGWSTSPGDGIMALFGAPRPHEDHAVRGCLAALAMQDAIRPRRSGSADPCRRHTGEVVVQAVSNGLYQTYDAAGATCIWPTGWSNGR